MKGLTTAIGARNTVDVEPFHGKRFPDPANPPAAAPRRRDVAVRPVRPGRRPRQHCERLVGEAGMDGQTVPEATGRGLSRRSALAVLGATSAGAVAGGVLGSAPARAAGAVELVDNGSTVILRNTLISVTVAKATAQIPTIQFVGSTHGNQSVNLVSGTGGRGYNTYDYFVGTTRFSKGLTGGSYRVVEQTDDRVEIAISGTDPAVLPFTVDLHFAVHRGLPGLYSYQVFGYPDGYPEGLTIQQLRYAFAAGDPSFTYFVVDDARGIQQRPSIQELAQAVTVQDTTYLLPNGRMYSKYQNISNLEGDNNVFMVSNGSLGLALVQSNKEAFAGGPTKQELTCHDYNNGEILLWHPFTSHYGSPDLEPPHGWQKVYGPFYLHVTEGSGTDPVTNVAEMWADAKLAAARERAQWPYSWVSEPLYAAGGRSAVTGKLTVADHVSTDGAWVVLSQPGPDRVYQGVTLDGDDWQYSNLDYVYSGRADRLGRFTIGAVRPGTYTLTAFVDGVIGEYKRHDVVVDASGHVDLGNLVWLPERHGRTVWQIGTPNRSAGEFHTFGGPDGFRKYLTWLEYPYEFPDGVDFRIGDPLEKWNYFQPCYRTPGTAFQLQLRGTTPDGSLTTWRIRFDSNGYRRGTATVDIALAGSVFGTLRVALNGTELASFDPLPGPLGDNSSYRLGCRGMYRRLPAIQFAATLIQPGENVLTLSPVRPPGAPLTRGNTVDDWMQPIGGVMYDVIRLQVEEG
jgi:rhamnogalacturonan endolyase